MWPPEDDVPAEKPRFAFDRLAETLARTLQQDRNAAFVLGLHGPWGAGKSTLLNAIRRKLTGQRIVVDFNAWKYQDREALWRALILRVLAALRHEKGTDQKVAKQLDELERSLYEGFTATEQGPLRINWTAAVTTGLQATLGLAAAGLGGGLLSGAASLFGKFFRLKEDGKPEGKVEDAVKQIKEAAGILERETISRAVRRVESIEQFVELFRQVMKDLGETYRVFVLIDDLDRCLPETALGIFEAIKLFLDSEKCAYVVAVDRAVIRRGLELRYPARSMVESRALPPVVDPDEYIEKTITLSVDLPMLADEDAHELLAPPAGQQGLSPEERAAIVTVLGANPRRLKRFGAMLALWHEVARAVKEVDKRELGFTPLKDADRPLFIKLALIGYLNSAVLAEMRRDPGLPIRLQEVCNTVFDKDDVLIRDAAKTIAEKMQLELPVIAQASLDAALWRALRLKPLLTTAAALPTALRWFRSAAAAK